MSKQASAESPAQGVEFAVAQSPFAKLGGDVLDTLGIERPKTTSGLDRVGQAAVGFYVLRRLALGDDVGAQIVDRLSGKPAGEEDVTVMLTSLVCKVISGGPEVTGVQRLINRLTDMTKRELDSGANRDDDPDAYTAKVIARLAEVMEQIAAIKVAKPKPKTAKPPAKPGPAPAQRKRGKAAGSALLVVVEPDEADELGDEDEEDEQPVEWRQPDEADLVSMGITTGDLAAHYEAAAADNETRADATTDEEADHSEQAEEAESEQSDGADDAGSVIEEVAEAELPAAATKSSLDQPDLGDDTEEAAINKQQIGELYTDSVRQYLNQLKEPLLTAAEEVELAKQIEAGLYAVYLLGLGELPEGVAKAELQKISKEGEAAKDRFIRANLKLVVSLARRRVRSGLGFLDLIQEGNTGLIKAVEKFNFAKGFKFSVYATWWIKQAIGRAIADQARTVRIPAGVVDQINSMHEIQRELTLDLGRSPEPHEVAKVMQVDVSKVEELMSYKDPISLNQSLTDDGAEEFGDFISDEESDRQFEVVETDLLQHHLRSVLDMITWREDEDKNKKMPRHMLTEREAGIIRLRYGLIDGKPRSLDAIAQVYRVTRERIRQIETKAMAKLKDSPSFDSLRGYLD